MVQRKRYVVGALIIILMLSGCGGTLQLANGLPTATPGFEPNGSEAPSATVLVEDTPANMLPVETNQPPEGAVPVPAEEPPPAPPVEDVLVNPELANVQLPAPADLEARWRDMQVERTPFEPASFVSSGWETVWWYDPLFGQLLPVGQLRGEFTVQARFRIKGQWISALEMPYNVGKQYDITVPDAILKRMQDAGKGDWAEVFVYETNDIQPK